MSYKQLDFLNEITGMVRAGDPETSVEAAEAVLPSLSALHQTVLAAYRRHGPMTAKQAERLPELANLGFSTVRKRVSELAQRGIIRRTDVVIDRCAIYEVVTP